MVLVTVDEVWELVGAAVGATYLTVAVFAGIAAWGLLTRTPLGREVVSSFAEENSPRRIWVNAAGVAAMELVLLVFWALSGVAAYAAYLLAM